MVIWRSVEKCKYSVVQFLARLKILAWNAVGTATSISQTDGPFSAKSLQPLTHRAFGYPELESDGCGLLPTISDSANN